MIIRTDKPFYFAGEVVTGILFLLYSFRKYLFECIQRRISRKSNLTQSNRERKVLLDWSTYRASERWKWSNIIQNILCYSWREKIILLTQNSNINFLDPCTSNRLIHLSIFILIILIFTWFILWKRTWLYGQNII